MYKSYADKIGATKQTALDLIYAEGVDPLVLAAADYLVRNGKGDWRYVRIDNLPIRTTEPDKLERGVLFAIGESTITVRESQARA